MRIIPFILLFFICISNCSSQDFFRSISESDIESQSQLSRSIIPEKYKVLDLKIEGARAYLLSELSSENLGKTIQLYNPSGKQETFTIQEVKMMEDGLASKYPGIKTYKGYNPKNPTEKVHLGISSTGFYASIAAPGKSYAIDRYADKQDRYYISYYLKDYKAEGGISHACGTIGKDLEKREQTLDLRSSGAALPLRTYRFALACTGEFGAFYGPDKEDVLGEMVKSVNRMNLVLENDFAIRLLLINENDRLIWIDADNDPYPDGNTGSSLLTLNTGVLSTAVGFGNFDIGHVYTRGCDDTGGVAFLESACTGNKGAGVTCHYLNDISTIAIRVAAHEVGHQLGSSHTFNNCAGNESTGTAYEPGSGSTIMSYGGLCGSALNVVSVSDDYFHISSIIQVTEYTRNFFGNSCATFLTTENTAPEVSIPMESFFSIPISTPFELSGEASDAEEDVLTYNWEQFNLGPTATPGSPVGNSPLFVSVYPDTNSTRVFPKMESIVNNESNKREVLPTYERDMNFMFVARDNNLQSGGVAWEELAFYTSETAGPFLVDFPSVADTFEAGEEIEIIWDVANTNNEIVNCQSVDIMLSIDGGYTYTDTLISQTPNDGREKVLVPNILSTTARIKIKATSSIFFDISNEDFTITEPTKPGFIFNFTPSYIRSCVPDDILINFTTESLLGYDKALDFEVVRGLQEGMAVEFSRQSIAPGEDVSASISFTDPSIAGVFTLQLEARSDTDTIRREILLDLTNKDFSDVSAISPTPGSAGNRVAPIFEWKGDVDATEYVFMLSDNPSFDADLSTVLYNETVTDTFFELDDILSKSKLYYWTVLGQNECGSEADGPIYTFGTEALSCSTYTYNDVPLGISQSGVIEITMPIDVIGDGQVVDVNVLKIRGTHTWVSELKGELVAPSGLSVLLFNKKCGNQSNFNAGFDDDAVGGITCPLNQGIFYQPEEALDTFSGLNIAGVWTFKLTDTKIGNGGTVQEYQLELCSNAVLESPAVVVNKQMPLPSGVGRRISIDFLKTEDENNSNDELKYTLVKTPTNGLLRNGEQALVVGSQFTQMDIDDMNIRYEHSGVGDSDLFVFTVEDGEGGWVDLTTFEIVIDENAILDVEDLLVPSYSMYPNPSNGLVHVVFSEYHQDINFQVYDVIGKKQGLNVSNSGGIHTINIRNAVSGIYFLEITGEGFRAVQKVVVE